MKKIEAIVKPFMLDDVKEHLLAIGIQGMTVSDVRGFRRQRGQTARYRGVEYVPELFPKTKIELLIPDHLETIVIDTIIEAARTGCLGDEMIVVTPVEEAVRVRTGERGAAAI
jgi:nitrogen regulatory protein P-II 1